MHEWLYLARKQNKSCFPFIPYYWNTLHSEVMSVLSSDTGLLREQEHSDVKLFTWWTTSTQYHSKMWHRSTVKCEMEVALRAGGNNIFKATKSVLVHSRVRLLQQTATSTFHVFKRQSVKRTLWTSVSVTHCVRISGWRTFILSGLDKWNSPFSLGEE